MDKFTSDDFAPLLPGKRRIPSMAIGKPAFGNCPACDLVHSSAGFPAESFTILAADKAREFRQESIPRNRKATQRTRLPSYVCHAARHFSDAAVALADRAARDNFSMFLDSVSNTRKSPLRRIGWHPLYARGLTETDNFPKSFSLNAASAGMASMMCWSTTPMYERPALPDSGMTLTALKHPDVAH